MQGQISQTKKGKQNLLQRNRVASTSFPTKSMSTQDPAELRLPRRKVAFISVLRLTGDAEFSCTTQPGSQYSSSLVSYRHVNQQLWWRPSELPANIPAPLLQWETFLLAVSPQPGSSLPVLCFQVHTKTTVHFRSSVFACVWNFHMEVSMADR